MANKKFIKITNGELTYIESQGIFFKTLDKMTSKSDSKVFNFIRPKKFNALKNVNISIAEGEFVALLGKSGAGKTTVIKAINGQNELNKGKLEIHGLDISKLSKANLMKLRKRVSTIFQDYDLISTLTVLQNVLKHAIPGKDFSSRLFNVASETEKQEAYEMLDKLGILKYANKKVRSLSGGQKQRVALARALLQEPIIMLADEPVSALDPKMMRVVMNIIKEANVTQGVTTIANMHHIEVAIKYADRIIGLNQGKVVYNGASRDITLKDLEKIYGDKIEGLSTSQIKAAQKANKVWKPYQK